MARPTEEAYGEFQNAYDFYNRKLFQDTLPPCLITLPRKTKRTFGYFSHQRFVHLPDGRSTTDEIAMNPVHFHARSVEDTLSTLAHEMVHLWEAHYGKAGKRGYHNKKWGAKMKEIGLYPSNTGDEGGKETGYQMSHYILPSGQFHLVTVALLAKGFSISWADAVATGLVDAPHPKQPKKSGCRVKYTCPGCKAHVWGKSGLHLLCGLDGQSFTSEMAESDDGNEH